MFPIPERRCGWAAVRIVRAGDQWRENVTMPIGTVKWFNTTKGFGFITPDEGGKDAFVHITAVQRAGLRSLNERQRIRFELQPGRNERSAAKNLSVIE